ncbi:MAG: hypothetical protein ABSF21_00850 [Dehalococcoidia bacterium]
MAKKLWIQGAIGAEGRLRKHFGVKEGETIPPEKIDAEIALLHKKTREVGGAGLTPDEESLLSALNLAKRMRGFSKGRKKK